MLKKEYGGFNTFSSNFEFNGVAIFNKYEYPLNLARHALQILIKCRSITHILAPFYTCHSIHKTLKDANIEISYYHIDRDFTPLLTDADVENSQALLINNYFGISGEVIDNLVQKYGSKIIVDNSQSYYSRHSEEIDHFNSPRKFFGVTDGGVLTTTRDISDLYSYLEFDKSADRINNLFASDESSMNDCYDDYLNYRPKKELEKWKKNCPIKNYKKDLIKKKILSQTSIEKMELEIKKKILRIFLSVKKDKFSDKKLLTNHIYAK